MTRTLGFKLGTIALLMLLLMIPLMLIDGLISERQAARNSVLINIAQSSSYSQRITGPILVVPEDSSLFVQVLRPEFPGKPAPGGNAQSMLSGNAWAAFPDAGFSLLHAIPPIGSKFRTAESTGPSGQKTVANGDYRGVVSFYFGPMGK